MYSRTLDLDLPRGQSAFLWGPRKTGKSTLLRRRFPLSARFDLLDTRLMLELTRAPWTLTERVRALSSAQRGRPILIDEVQKVPALLDEVHRLIEDDGLGFVLCGSSARKLRRGKANLLGGRAWSFGLHPLTWPEVPEFDLLRALNHGLLPSHYDSPRPRRRHGHRGEGRREPRRQGAARHQGLRRGAPAPNRDRGMQCHRAPARLRRRLGASVDALPGAAVGRRAAGMSPGCRPRGLGARSIGGWRWLAPLVRRNGDLLLLGHRAQHVPFEHGDRERG